ncbi:MULTISPECIES: (2Fe-2S) ferredoxin domain-containing protein [unclassified Rhizobium]|uniref:(2Fe-2S) ferredoxin domain-containing protein n=1 Tax=unclassified Rhizobium TaxID=2613769 RepID=UPI002479D79A|nr:MULTISPECIES: (2Fe-2S) ferredoxin domain-containing protein [unclassified Rhizobium]MDH7800805.1 (2Fe-2S) ferredoxin [Rhizobium sp. AN70]
MTTETEPTNREPSAPDAVLLVAKSAFAAAPHQDMRRLAALTGQLRGAKIVRFAFTEQGTPSLREALFELIEEDVGDVLLVPLMLPLEPSFHNWLIKTLKRWRAADSRPWPSLSIAANPTSSALMVRLLEDLAETAQALDLSSSVRPAGEGSLVPAQKRRVLVCQGGPCNSAGADVIWGHLRNQQERQKLRVTGDGTMTAKSTCLGPCNLAPVMQVFPEGTYYGGVTEEAVDRIVAEHLLGGCVVDDFAYHPTGRKQRLRNLSE